VVFLSLSSPNTRELLAISADWNSNITLYPLFVQLTHTQIVLKIV